jgi:hypothetical protein
MKRTILVTGDIVLDHHLYKGKRQNPGDVVSVGGRSKLEFGGAKLCFEIIKACGSQPFVCVKRDQSSSEVTVATFFGISDVAPASMPLSRQCFAIWEPRMFDNVEVWRTAELLGYGGIGGDDFLPTPASDILKSPADVIVIDDGAMGIRNTQSNALWPDFLRDTKPSSEDAPWIIHKMTGPILQGDLWRAISGTHRDRSIVLVSGSDIRFEAVRVSSGISWERTALDLAFELRRNPAIASLTECRHCVITFGMEGALHYDRGENGTGESCTLLYDPAYQEGDWSSAIDGGGVGKMSCIAAGLACRIATAQDRGEEITDAVRNGAAIGLQTARQVIRHGHGKITDANPGPPLELIGQSLRADNETFQQATVPMDDGASGSTISTWSILSGNRDANSHSQPLTGIARRVALYGPSQLSRIPHQRFGKLLVADRSEIESLRNVQIAIQNYKRKKQAMKPLSIAVFGSPGSGKSFGVKQIAKAVLGKDAPILEFNLSQFRPGDDQALAAALHQVRDAALGPYTPVVFWDEFDSQEYAWLRYLLSPMQDGQFQEGQITHPIGRCIFIFAGGTSHTFERFGTDPRTETAFRMSKGPDFKSRLHVYLNVLGPNPRTKFDEAKSEWVYDPADMCYPIRRSLLLRSMLGLFGDEPLDIDDGILTALLEIDKYEHGARSMENIITQLKDAGVPNVLRRSDLASPEVVSMHANYEKLMSLANQNLEFKKLADRLAPAIHAYYLAKFGGLAEADANEVLTSSKRRLLEFKKLDAEMQSINVAAALRIPKNLSVAGLRVMERPESELGKPAALTKPIDQIIEDQIEAMAQEEHIGWMKALLINGWRYGEVRDNAQKLHPCLKEYSQLPEKEKDKDRNAIRNYPNILALENYTITHE